MAHRPGCWGYRGEAPGLVATNLWTVAEEGCSQPWARSRLPRRAASTMILRMLLLLAVLAVLMAPAAHARRVALVIGNAAYADGPLRNPVNDARLMQRTLADLGFDVVALENANFQRMQRAVREFGNRASGAEVALVYFAGHGVQSDGENYLLPVGAQIDKEADLPAEGVAASVLLRQVEGSGARVGIVVLDACRNNPFRARTRSGARGLGRLDAPAGSIVAFAAQANAVADDGTGDNGLYTRHLARQLREPGLDIREVFERTAIAVERESGGKQRPREDIGLRGRFVLNASAAAAVSAPPVAPAAVRVQTPEEIEQALWDDIRSSRDVRDFHGYLRRYPSGRFAALAERQLRLLEAPASAPTSAPALTTPSVAAPATAAGDTAQVVRIGTAAPLSGAQVHYGRDNTNGVRMAIDELNSRGVLIGGRQARFEMDARDDASTPQLGATVAQQFCDLGVQGVVGHLNSGTTIPASPIYHRCGIPHITPSATNPKLTQQGFTTSFRLLANDNALGAGLALHAARNLKLTRVAVLDDRTAYGQGVAEVFRRVAQANGLQVVDSQFTSDRSTDFSAVLTAIKARMPEAIFFGGMDSQAGPMLRQMDQLGMSGVKLMGGDGICTSRLAELSGQASSLGNVVCAEGGASLDRMPGGRAWKQRYDAKFPGQFQVYSPYTYDATMVLAAAMVRAGSADPRVYLPVLRSISHQGVTQTIQFEPDGELRNPSMTLYTYSNGRKVPLN